MKIFDFHSNLEHFPKANEYENLLPPESPKIPVATRDYTKFSRSGIAIPSYINPELAYLAGALRDGSISRTATSIGIKYYVAFCNTSYEWLNNVIRPILEKTFQINVTKPCHDRKPTKFQVRVRKHAIALFLADLFQHPFGKQINWRTPIWIESAPQEIKKWYVRGFFDSEGGCGNVLKQKDKYPWQSVFFIAFHASASGDVCFPLEDLKKMLNGFGIASREIKQDVWKRKSGFGTKEKPFFLKIVTAEDKLRFAELIGSSHPEKRNNLLALTKMIAARS